MDYINKYDVVLSILAIDWPHLGCEQTKQMNTNKPMNINYVAINGLT